MTDQEINVAIAEACGYEWYESDTRALSIPDYCHNLNAMHDAEMNHLGDIDEYVSRLKYVCNPYCDITNEHNQWCHIFATARQRAEAFLRTIGKWKD